MKTLKYILKKFDIKKGREVPTNIFTDREALLELFKELKFKMGVEVGTAEGLFAEKMIKVIPNLKLYMVDPYNAYPAYVDYDQDGCDKCLAEVKERMKDTNSELIQLPSMEALDKFEDNSLDFVYIDANHDYKFVFEDVEGWSKKVRKGGIVSGHDYGQDWGVKKAIQDYVKENGIKTWFVLGVGHYLNWFWVKGENV